VVKRHVDAWLSEPALTAPGAFSEMRDRIRDMNQETSQEVFVGPYLPTELRSEFSAHFRNMTDGFLSLPLPVPGTAVWRGMQSRKAVIRILAVCAAQSKARLAAGGSPACLLDFWTEYLMGENEKAAAQNQLPNSHAGNDEIADVMMDFLFASQDASTASLTWLAALLCDHPDVLARVRAEQAEVRPDLSGPLDGDTLYRMKYTRQVVDETLRWRPVAPMVPQLAAADFALADGVVAPKGSLVIPSLMASVWSGQGFPKGDVFDPDRMGPERGEKERFKKHNLTFGCGPHACVGYKYAENHLVAFAARLAASVELRRSKNARSDELFYLPTVYPRDCLLHMAPRAQPGAQAPAGAQR
jgi:cytochrome P450 family 710 subfamily A protein